MIVSDGFVGNVVLKVCEGVFEFVMKMVAKERRPRLAERQDPASTRLQALIHKHDYSAYGGAPLLGIDGICIICHGSSGERAIKNALGRRGQIRRVRFERQDRRRTVGGAGPRRR